MTSLADYAATLPASAAANGGTKAVLPSLGVLRVTGADAVDFLHAQFTADLKRLAKGQGGPAAWCTPKGRVLFLLDVLNAGDEGCLLLAPADEIPALAKRLRLYVLRARVMVEDLRDTWSVMGLAGDAVPATLATPGDAQRIGEAWLLRVCAVPALAYAFGPHAAVIAQWQAAGAAMIDAAQWERQEIAASRPRIAGPLAEQFLPQELDLERLQGVHFDKGCYPGQEIVARLKYRGQVKAGLHRARTSGPVAPGDRIFRVDASASVGDVLRVAPGDGGWHTLIVLDFAARDSALHLGDAQGPLLHIDA